MDDSTGEQKGHTEHAAQHQREEQHEIEAALENVGPEDGRGDKADDGARPVPDRMESHPLVAVGAVAGGDIGRGAGQDGSLLPRLQRSRRSPGGWCGKSADRFGHRQQ